MSDGNSTIPEGFSYVRFSNTIQSKGDSLRRQTDGTAADWCNRHGVLLNTNVTLRDLGKSAFTGEHRKNPDRHALALFLKMVETGRVARGSYLIVENLDRLSREHIQPALLLCLHLIQAGIRIVQLKPVEMVFDEKSDTMQLMMMIMELSRGHNESALKSHRVAKAWKQKVVRARETGEVITMRLPAWIEKIGSALVLKEEAAMAIRLIFQLAMNGHGLKSIVKELQDRKIKPIVKSGRWTTSYVNRILRDRRVLGEFQPRSKDGTSVGELIPNYYPAVVSESQWLAARAGAAERKVRRGAKGSYLNVFQGLTRNARKGDTYYVVTRKTPLRGVYRVLINAGAHENQDTVFTFPLEAFEKAVFMKLSEIDPREILNGNSKPDETAVLAGQLAQVDARIAALEEELVSGDVAAVVKVLRKLEAEKKELNEKLLTARQQAVYPLSESWGECQSLLSVLQQHNNSDEIRLRLRSVLRRIVDSIWMLVITRGHHRLCAVQIFFKDSGRRRDYLIYYRGQHANRVSRKPGFWRAWSMADFLKPGKLDLRNKAHANDLEATLERIPLDQFLSDP